MSGAAATSQSVAVENSEQADAGTVSIELDLGNHHIAGGVTAPVSNPLAVDCLRPIADAISAGRTIDIANLVVNDNGDIELLSGTRSCGFRFELSGVPVHVGMRTDGQQIRLTLSGDLGYLPYSIENQERRRAINAVIAATGDLSFSRFELVDHRHIMLRGHRMMPRPFQLVDMFMGLVDMIHELTPFMALLGDCLDHDQRDIPVPGQWKPMNATSDPAAQLMKWHKHAQQKEQPNRYGIAAE